MKASQIKTLDIRLVFPCEEYKSSFLEHMRESEDDSYYAGYQFSDIETSFEDFLDYFKNLREGNGLPPGWVADNHYWIIVNGEYAGRIDLRHELTENLRQFGGHVGYEVISSQRRKGIATKALQALLPEAEKLGLKELLITCNDDNIASIKVIEKAGGVLEDKIQTDLNPKGGLTRRYWIRPVSLESISS